MPGLGVTGERLLARSAETTVPRAATRVPQATPTRPRDAASGRHHRTAGIHVGKPSLLPANTDIGFRWIIVDGGTVSLRAVQTRETIPA